MRQQINVITLGVENLEKSLAFYREGLGLSSKGIIGTEYHDDISGANGAVALFELQNGLILSLYPRTDLAKDAKQEIGAGNPSAFSLGYLTETKEQVDAILQQAKAAGATITDEPRERPWGIYSGYFTDVDGHLWEIIWNPDMTNEGSAPFSP
jgi:uncharacterized protein